MILAQANHYKQKKFRPEDETGILFMGLQHTVDKYLNGIKISYLIHRLPFRESYDVTMIKQ